MWLASSAVGPLARLHHGGNAVKTAKPGLRRAGKSEDAMLSGVDVEQHLVVDVEWRGQPLQRQPEQRQRQLEQRHEQQLRDVCPLESHPLMGVRTARRA